ncbi:MAG: hypothetical protein EB116_17215 [Betaproteobacteria bacterium]|nr:hypothetical protein [Betaproteobacteria bacterium]
MPRPLCATIDVSRMRANFALLREQLQPFRCWAVVKANAYGHGLDAGLLGFEEADGLALIEPAFARYLREKGWRKPILASARSERPSRIARCATLISSMSLCSAAERGCGNT